MLPSAVLTSLTPHLYSPRPWILLRCCSCGGHAGRVQLRLRGRGDRHRDYWYGQYTRRGRRENSPLSYIICLMPLGVVSHTGCGLIFTGGVGYLTKAHSTAADNIIEVTIATAWKYFIVNVPRLCQRQLRSAPSLTAMGVLHLLRHRR